jgi:hypothetical protein
LEGISLKNIILFLLLLPALCSAQSVSPIKTRHVTFYPQGPLDLADTLSWIVDSNTNGGHLWHWPNGNGTSGQALTNNGSGVLSWQSLTTGTVTSITAGTGLTGGTITTTGTIALNVPVLVNLGGTGDITLALNGPLYGNGTSNVLAMAVNASAREMFLSQTSSGAPVWDTLPGSGLTDAVIINPSTTARNIITPTTFGVVPLTVNDASGSSAHIQEWQNNTLLVARINSDGSFVSNSSITAGGVITTLAANLLMGSTGSLMFAGSGVDTWNLPDSSGTLALLSNIHPPSNYIWNQYTAQTSAGFNITAGAPALTSGLTETTIDNNATSTTASIAKCGLNIESTGTWSGAGANNTGLALSVNGGAQALDIQGTSANWFVTNTGRMTLSQLNVSGGGITNAGSIAGATALAVASTAPGATITASSTGARTASATMYSFSDAITNTTTTALTKTGFALTLSGAFTGPDATGADVGLAFNVSGGSTNTDINGTGGAWSIGSNGNGVLSALSLNTNLAVNSGGTGAGTLTGILKGNGTSAITAITIPADATKYLDGTGAFSVPGGGGYGTGTVTNVTGTTNQIDVATGTTTPVISIDANYAGQSSITSVGTIASGVWAGTSVSLSHGGTSAALTASNGGIFYSTASAAAILSGTATARKALLSGASTTPIWSAETYAAPSTSGNVMTSDGTNWTSAPPSSGGTANIAGGTAGAIPYQSAANTTAVLAATTTALQILQSGASAAPTWSTATYPATTTANKILYSSADNVINEISTSNYGILTTNGSGIPSIGFSFLLDGTGNRSVSLAANTNDNAPGQGLSIIAGAPKTANSTNNEGGGMLTLESGYSQGTGTSAVDIYAAPAGVSGNVTNSPILTAEFRAVIPLKIDSPSGFTGDLQEWYVNTTKEAFIKQDGTFSTAGHLLTTSSIGAVTKDATGVTAASATGSDIAGSITYTTALNAGGGYVNVAFGTTYSTAPTVVIGPGTTASVSGNVISGVSVSGTAFRINFSATVVEASAILNYIVVH